MLAFLKNKEVLMKSLFFLLFLFSSAAQAETIVHYTYKKTKNPVKKSIDLKELQSAYQLIKKSTFKAPGPEEFFRDYLRFKLGVEVALHESRLVKSPQMDRQIVNPYLKQAIHQELYKALAEMRLKKQTQKLDQSVSQMSLNSMKRLYAQEPEFNIFFIAIYHPVGPTARQIKEAQDRAGKIYNQVIQSKKPFVELVTLYSDDKSNGVLNINRSRASIFPEVYERLKSMRNNSISKPIRVPSGYIIVKLNQKVPFEQANQTAIKANYFNKRRTAIFNSYFDKLKKDFEITFVNQKLIKTL